MKSKKSLSTKFLTLIPAQMMNSMRLWPNKSGFLFTIWMKNIKRKPLNEVSEHSEKVIKGNEDLSKCSGITIPNCNKEKNVLSSTKNSKWKLFGALQKYHCPPMNMQRLFYSSTLSQWLEFLFHTASPK